jgi:hypothetical protein
MAHEEMATVRELDITLLDENRHRIYMYFAAEDDWVSTHKAKITRSYLPSEAAMVVEQANVPHAFCIGMCDSAFENRVLLLKPYPGQFTAARSPANVHYGSAL